MKKLICIVPFIPFLSLFSQVKTDTSYYENGKIKWVVNFKDSIREGEAKFFFENGNIKEETNYLNGKVNGLVKKYNEQGKLSETVNIMEGKREGPASMFDSAGVYLTDVDYKNGKRIMEEDPWDILNEKKSRIVVKKVRKQPVKKKEASIPVPPVTEEEEIVDAPLYYISPEVMPEPVGGVESINKRLRYPAAARLKGIEGVVKVSVLIDQYGEVKNAVVVEGIGYGCDEAARTVVFYTKFKPGMQRGKPVTVQTIIPVEFRLAKPEKSS